MQVKVLGNLDVWRLISSVQSREEREEVVSLDYIPSIAWVWEFAKRFLRKFATFLSRVVRTVSVLPLAPLVSAQPNRSPLGTLIIPHSVAFVKRFFQIPLIFLRSPFTIAFMGFPLLTLLIITDFKKNASKSFGRFRRKTSNLPG